MKRCAGVTLLEMAIVVMMGAILTAAFGTAIYSTVASERERAAAAQLEEFKRAIVGEGGMGPAAGRDPHHGYIGDFGSLPAALSALEAAGAQPGYSVDSLRQLGAGWRGPYVSTTIANSGLDPWGNGIVYTASAGTSALTGAATVATLRSRGPDGQSGNADDAVVEIYRSDAFSQVLGYVRNASGATMPGVAVTVWYPTSGVVASASTITNSQGAYVFNDIPQGRRVFQFSPGLAYQSGSGVTTGGAANNVQFVIENLSNTAISVTSIRLTWTTSPATDFKRLLIDGVEVFDGTAASGATINFASRTFTASGVADRPLALHVSGPTLLAPDTYAGAIGAGGAMLFRMEDFEQVGTGTNVNMNGVTFSVEFSDGSTALFSPLP